VDYGRCRSRTGYARLAGRDCERYWTTEAAETVDSDDARLAVAARNLKAGWVQR